MQAPKGRFFSKFGIGFLAQAVQSLGSLLYLIAAAQSLSAQGLGDFSLYLASVLLSISVARAFCGESFLVSVSSDTPSDGRGMLATSVAFGLFLSACWLAVSFFWEAQRAGFVVVAISVPAFVFADALRFYLIGSRADKELLVFDALYVSIAVSTIFIAASLSMSPSITLGWWACTVLLNATAASVVGGCIPRFRGCLKWAKSHFIAGSAFAVEAIVGAIVGYLVVVLLALFSAAEDVAAFRAAISIFGVTSLVINFSKTILLREVRISTSGSNHRRFVVIMISLSVSAITVSLVALLLLPESWGLGLFGDTWILVVPLLVVASLNRLTASLSTIPMILLRTMGVTWKATRVRSWMSLVALAFGPVGALFAGARGALITEGLSYLLLALCLSILYRTESRAARDDQ